VQYQVLRLILGNCNLRLSFTFSLETACCAGEHVSTDSGQKQGVKVESGRPAGVELLKRASLASALFGFGVSLAHGQDARKRQRFRIGMAATEWLALNPTTATYWTACDAIAQLRIGAVEPDNSAARLDVVYGKRPSYFTQRSIKLGVCLTGVYQALPLHDPSKMGQMRAKISSVAGFLRAVCAKYLNLGWEVPRHNGRPGPFSRQEVRNAVHAMDELGKVSSDRYRIPIAYHAERDTSKEAFRQIMDETNPTYVHFCADVGHLTAMGLDAVGTVNEYFPRLRVSHWKDFDPALPAPKYLGEGARGGFVELGKGVVNFHALAKIFLSRGFDGWTMIELDRTREPSITESARQMETYVTGNLRLQVYKIRHRPLPGC
jgi:sugar phosphate isomerase/epimerase